MSIAGDIIILTGIVFILIGVAGFLMYKDFYTRILVTAKIDIVGTITILIGSAVKHGFSFFSAKAVLLVIVLMIVNPLATHMIVRAAYAGGLRPERGDENTSEDTA